MATLVASLAAGACGGEGGPLVPTATLPQSTTTTNPYAVPAVIDEAYVNRVLAGLDQAVGEVVRLVVSTRTIPPEAIERLKSMYSGDRLQLEVGAFQDDMFNSFAGYREPPGNQRTTVNRLIAVTPGCIFAQVRKDFSNVGFSPDPRLSAQWIALVPVELDRDPFGYNPTNWAFKYDGFPEDFSQPPNPCADS